MSHALSPFRRCCQRLSRQRLAMLGLFLIALFILFALFSGFFAPYGPNDYGRPLTNKIPPMAIHWVNPETGQWTRPFVYGMKRTVDEKNFKVHYQEIKTKRYPIRLFFSGDAYTLFGLWTCHLHLFGVNAPGKIFLLGTDEYGRDLFSRIIWGTQISLLLAFLATLLSIVLGCVLGGIAGYYGGWIDMVLMRLIEVIYAIPTLFLLLALRAIIPLDTDPLYVMLGTIAILGLLSWGGLARVVRGSFLSLRERDYVLAAKALGIPEYRIIFVHILPEIMAFVFVTATLAMPANILITSFLSFLGLGVTSPYVDWGLLLNQAQNAGATGIAYTPWILIPGVFLVIIVVAFNLFGDGLRDALDPKHVEQKK